MNGPGDSASKQHSGQQEPILSSPGEGHGGAPTNAELVQPRSPGSQSSARSQLTPAREPGDLDVASTPVVGARQLLEGEEPHGAAVSDEESDAGVVPRKPTKTWVTPVESTEGRAAAEGKSVARNASPTQGGPDAITYLQRMGQRSKDRPEERFTNLLCHVKAPQLREAYESVRRNAAAGVDGVTWSEYGLDLDRRLLDLQDRIHRGSYHPQPVRRVHIPKGDGRTRPLGIPALEDKIVQQAVRRVLEPIYEAMFVGFSYGFRPGRSPHDALDALAEAIARKVSWVLDADIRSFFDTIDHGWMQKFIEHRIGDTRMVRLLMKWLHAGVMEDGVLRDAEEGTPQGGIISPLLANIYLHYALDLWVLKWRRTQARGAMYIVRFADDFVMAFQREQDAVAMRKALAERMAHFGLELHPDKTRVIQFGRFAREDRMKRGLPKPETFDFLGFTHIADVDRQGRFRLKRRTSRKKKRAKLASLREEIRRRRHDPVVQQHRYLCAVLRGHERYYGVPLNLNAMRSFHRSVERCWHSVLQRRSQRSKWTQTQRKNFETRYPLPSPRVHHPWPEKRFADR